MKKLKNTMIIIILIMSISNISLAHGGNITGWKDKNSKYITEYNGKYYGYHKEDGIVHYHQVKWDEENQKWIIIAPAVYYDENFNKIENNTGNSTNKVKVKLVSTVDGDTAKFEMNGEQVTVRFLGINTKETVDPQVGEEAWGKEASDFTKDKLQNANKIELEFDSSSDEKDKYDRYLAWIWVDDELLQNLLVENGLAENYMLQNNYKYAGILQESQEIAKNNKLGIWSDKTNNLQNNESKNQIAEDNKVNNESNNSFYLILGIILVVIISIFNLVYSKRKNNSIK